VRKYLYFVLLYLLYRVKWIEHPEGERGFFLVKRRWIWLFGFPLVVIPVIIIGIYNEFMDIFSYDQAWISGRKRKLSFKEKLIMADRLFK
jgi:hypothetical protein